MKIHQAIFLVIFLGAAAASEGSRRRSHRHRGGGGGRNLVAGAGAAVRNEFSAAGTTRKGRKESPRFFNLFNSVVFKNDVGAKKVS